MGDVGHLLGIVEGVQRAEIQRLQRVQLQIVAGEVGAVIEGHVGTIDVRRAGAHGHRGVLCHMIAAADEPQQVVQITAIDDGGRTAAQTDGLHLAVGQVGGVGLELQRHGQHIPVQQFGVVALDEGAPAEGRLAGDKGKIELHHDRMQRCRLHVCFKPPHNSNAAPGQADARPRRGTEKKEKTV